MKFDHDWLMMVMGKFMGQYDRGLVGLADLFREIDLVIHMHRQWVAKEASCPTVAEDE